MAYDLTKKLVVAVSARALFRLGTEQKKNKEESLLQPGAAFWFIHRLLRLNKIPGQKERVEVVLISRGGADLSLQIFPTLAHYGMGMTRAFFPGGSDIAPYLSALHVDLLLSVHPEDVQAALEMGVAAGVIDETASEAGYEREEEGPLRFAFDGDAVLFDGASEQIFKSGGLAAFEENEVRHARMPLKAGPFAAFLKKILALQRELEREAGGEKYIRTALVTSRCAPAHERVIRTFKYWNMELDEVFFLGGIAKKEILQAFGADIFFDDQSVHTEPASEAVLSALVAYRESAGHEENTEHRDVAGGKESTNHMEYADNAQLRQTDAQIISIPETEGVIQDILQDREIIKTGNLYEIRQYSGRRFPGEAKQVYRLCGDRRKARDGPCQKYRPVQRAPSGRG